MLTVISTANLKADAILHVVTLKFKYSEKAQKIWTYWSPLSAKIQIQICIALSICRLSDLLAENELDCEMVFK